MAQKKPYKYHIILLYYGGYLILMSLVFMGSASYLTPDFNVPGVESYQSVDTSNPLTFFAELAPYGMVFLFSGFIFLLSGWLIVQGNPLGSWLSKIGATFLLIGLAYVYFSQGPDNQSMVTSLPEQFQLNVVKATSAVTSATLIIPGVVLSFLISPKYIRGLKSPQLSDATETTV